MRSSPELIIALALFAGCQVGPAGSAVDAGSVVDAGGAAECPSGSTLSFENFAEPFFLAWCTGCHSTGLTGDRRSGAPVGFDFDTLGGVQAHAERIRARAVDLATMPPAGGPPEIARRDLGEWLTCGARSSKPPSVDAGIISHPPPDGGQAPNDAGEPAPPPVFSNSGDYASMSTPDRAFCGPAACDVTTGAYCCIAPDSPPACNTADATCTIHIACDGPEDCSGQVCCLTPNDQGGARVACAASCGDHSAIACHRAADCPGASPICCGGAGAPFGHCTTMSMAAPGEQCDVP